MRVCSVPWWQGEKRWPKFAVKWNGKKRFHGTSRLHFWHCVTNIWKHYNIALAKHQHIVPIIVQLYEICNSNRVTTGTCAKKSFDFDHFFDQTIIIIDWVCLLSKMISKERCIAQRGLFIYVWTFLYPKGVTGFCTLPHVSWIMSSQKMLLFY